MQLDITNWTALLIAFSPLLIALLRRDTMSDEQTLAITLATTVVLFFCGRALDGVLTWPLGASTATQLAAALTGQQIIYQLLKKTTLIRTLEQTQLKP